MITVELRIIWEFGLSILGLRGVPVPGENLASQAPTVFTLLWSNVLWASF